MNVSLYKEGLGIPFQKAKVITPEGTLKELTKEECELSSSFLFLETYCLLLCYQRFQIWIG